MHGDELDTLTVATVANVVQTCWRCTDDLDDRYIRNRIGNRHSDNSREGGVIRESDQDGYGERDSVWCFYCGRVSVFGGDLNGRREQVLLPDREQR